MVYCRHVKTGGAHGSTMLSIERLTQYLAGDPANPELAGDLFDAYFHASRYCEAIALLQALPIIVQQSPGMQFRQAQLDLATGNYLAAEQRLSPLWAADQQSLALGHDLAFSLLCQRRLNDARAVLAVAEATHPAQIVVQLLLARVELLAGNFVGAEEHLEAALSLEPRNPTVLGLRALCRLDAGDMHGADAAAVACLQQVPDQHEALLAAGALALSRQQVEMAGQHFSRALERHPNSGRALSGLGQVQMLGNQLEQAEKTLQHAVTAMPDHIGTWHALAWAQLLLGDIAGAEGSYRDALSLDRNFGESHGGLAIVELLTGRVTEGEASMKRALKLDPACVSGRYAKSLWLQHDGKEAESTAIYAELLARDALPGIAGQDPAQLAQRLKARITSGRVIP